MKQVFIADTHFGHDKFHSDNWEYKFWKKYNSINTDFILYHLGDLSFDESALSDMSLEDMSLDDIEL